jgi:hypothetical protein
VKRKTHTTRLTIYNFSHGQLLGESTCKKEEKRSGDGESTPDGEFPVAIFK